MLIGVKCGEKILQDLHYTAVLCYCQHFFMLGLVVTPWSE